MIVSNIWLLNNEDFYRATRAIEVKRVIQHRQTMIAEIKRLKAAGVATSTIARQLGIGRRTVTRYLSGK